MTSMHVATVGAVSGLSRCSSINCAAAAGSSIASSSCDVELSCVPASRASLNIFFASAIVHLLPCRLAQAWDSCWLGSRVGSENLYHGRRLR